MKIYTKNKETHAHPYLHGTHVDRSFGGWGSNHARRIVSSFEGDAPLEVVRRRVVDHGKIQGASQHRWDLIQVK